MCIKMDLPLDQIICHDIAKGIPLSDECINVVISSPPYYGLRDYGASVQSIFGGDPKCKHKWGNKIPPRGNKSGKHGPQSIIGAKKGQDGAQRGSGNQFCQMCGAWQGQLGLEPHPQMYIDNLVQICREIKRVLRPTGSVYINLGDTYYGGGQGGGNKNSWKGKDKKYGHVKHKTDGNWLQPKQLMLIPSRVAVALQNDGWILRNDICWNKVNHMPSSVKDRLANSWEHVFHFVKSPRYYYDLDIIREPHKAESLVRASYGFHMIPRAWKQEAIPISGGKDIDINCHPDGKNPGDIIRNGTHHGSGLSNRATYYDQQISPMCDPDGKNPGDVLAYNSKYESVPNNIASESRLLNRVARDRKLKNIPHDLSTCHPSGKNPGDFLSLTTQPFTGYSEDLEHFAVFPEDLVMRPLLASCPQYVCKKCGKARERISKLGDLIRNPTTHESHGYTGKRGSKLMSVGNDPLDSKAAHWKRDKFIPGLTRIHETVSWSDCGCNKGFESGVVLDPFCGRGTVGKVAKRLGFHYIMIDIKPEYCELARLYIADQKYKIQKGQKKLKTS